MNLIFEGIILGIGLSFSTTTVSFILLFVTVSYGKRKAYFLLSQIIVIDFIIILTIYLGKNLFNFEEFINNKINNLIAIILLIFGIYKIIKKGIEKNILKKLILQSIIVNLINPLVWLFWLGFLSLIYSRKNPILLGFLSLSIFIFLELIKINYFYKLNKIVSLSNLRYLEKIIGFIFLLSGIKLLLFK